MSKKLMLLTIIIISSTLFSIGCSKAVVMDKDDIPENLENSYNSKIELVNLNTLNYCDLLYMG